MTYIFWRSKSFQKGNTTHRQYKWIWMWVQKEWMNEWVQLLTHIPIYCIKMYIDGKFFRGIMKYTLLYKRHQRCLVFFFLQAKATRHKCYQKCHNQESVKGAESSSFLMKFVRKRIYNEQKQWNNNINKVAATITIDIKSFSVVGPQWLNEFQRICI